MALTVDTQLLLSPAAGLGELHVYFVREDGSPAQGSVVIGGQQASAVGGLAIVGNIPTGGADGVPVPYTTYDGNGQRIGDGALPIPYSFYGVAATLWLQGASQ